MIKNELLDVDAILSWATAELSMPQPDLEKAKRHIAKASEKILKLAEQYEGKNENN